MNLYEYALASEEERIASDSRWQHIQVTTKEQFDMLKGGEIVAYHISHLETDEEQRMLMLFVWYATNEEQPS